MYMYHMLPAFVSGILQDSNNSYWLASLVDGLFRFNPSTGTCVNIPIYYNGKNIKGVTSIVEDNNKNIWIGVMGGGLFRWDMRKNKLFAIRNLAGKKNSNEKDNALHCRWHRLLMGFSVLIHPRGHVLIFQFIIMARI